MLRPIWIARLGITVLAANLPDAERIAGLRPDATPVTLRCPS